MLYFIVDNFKWLHFKSENKNTIAINACIISFFSAFQEATKKKMMEEEEKFIEEIADFNNEYEITKSRELLVKENVKIEISDLENQANILKEGMEAIPHLSGIHETEFGFRCF